MKHKVKKTRMKKFEVTGNMMHESFGGYDHNDGEFKKVVLARNEDSAKKKAREFFYKNNNGWLNVTSIFRVGAIDEQEE